MEELSTMALDRLKEDRSILVERMCVGFLSSIVGGAKVLASTRPFGTLPQNRYIDDSFQAGVFDSGAVHIR
jgi:hypothetical protein